MSEWNDDGMDLAPRKSFLRRWLSRFWCWIRNFFAVLGFVYTAIPLLLIWLVVQHGPQKKSPSPKAAGPVAMWLHLDRGIQEVAPKMSDAVLMSLFGQDQGLYIPDIRNTLRTAATDANVKELHLVVDGLYGSMADLEELRGVISDFKASQKPVTAWVHHLDNAALLVASVGDKIHLAPVAEVMIPGPTFPHVYLGEAIRKIGIDLQVVRAGKYKSAFEALIANEPSSESKEMMGALESSLRNRMVKLVAEGRKKQDSEAFLWFKESIFTPAKAKELGMVDELAYLPSVDFDDGENILFEDYFSDQQSSHLLPKGYSLAPEKGLALIEAAGEISGMGQGDDPRLITPALMQEELEWARTNKDVAAVVLRIASPGGSASASDEIWEYVRRLNAEKPVIASFGSVAASGGYYIAVAARKIIADPSTITGSIGVIGMIPNFEPFKDKYGVTFPITTQSNRASMLSGGKKMTAEDHQYIGNTIDDTYRTFKSRVAEGRKMTLDKVESLAQGRVYTGMQAKDLGLVDDLGSLKDAFQLAKKEAGLDETKFYPVHRYEPSEFSLSECMTSVSKMRRCLRKHGGQLKQTIKGELLSEQEQQLLKAQNTYKQLSRERIAALYTAGTPK